MIEIKIKSDIEDDVYPFENVLKLLREGKLSAEGCSLTAHFSRDDQDQLIYDIEATIPDDGLNLLSDAVMGESPEKPE